MSTESGIAAGSMIPPAFSQAFSEPEKLLAAFFKSSAVGLCIVDDGLRYLAVNETLGFQLYGPGWQFCEIAVTDAAAV